MQYIKISKELRTELTPKAFMMYGMIAAYLAIPKFQATHGGFKLHLRKHTANGRCVFDAAWQELQGKGFLKMIRVPYDHNKFYYRYELRSKADTDTPASASMGSREGRTYLHKNLPLYTEPTENYYTISREVLLSDALTFNDKWLWLIANDQKDLFEKDLLTDRDGAALPYLKKEDIRRATGFCLHSFEKAWSDLKKNGYLQQTRFFDRQYGVTRFEYTLSDISTPGIAPAQTDPRQRRHIAEPLPPVTPNAIVDARPATPSINLDYKAIEAVVKENIWYDDMLRFTGIHNRQPDGFWYSKGNLDAVVSRMVGAICSKKHNLRVNGTEMPVEIVRERLLTLDSGDVLNALRGIWAVESEGGEIGHKRAYLLTALFNSIEG